MISKFVILVLLPILLTVVYLSSADENIVGIISLGLMMIGLFCSFVIGTPLLGTLLLIISLHWFQLEGISYSIYFMLFAVSCFTLYCIKHGGCKIEWMWVSLAMSQIGYMAMVLAVRPYPLKKIFFFVLITGLIFFLGTSLIRWTASTVQTLITVHLCFFIIWAFIERIVSIETRIEGPSFSSTNFAVLLAVSWTIWFINGWINKQTHWIWLVLMTFFVFVAIMLSGTRMGILGMCLGSVLGVLSRLTILQRKRVLSLIFKFFMMFIVLFILGFGLWQLVPDDLFLKQGLNVFASGKLDSSSIGRIAAWVTAVDIVKQNPLWGIGPGNFLSYNIEFLQKFDFLPIMQYVPRLGHAHNLPLMILSEHGFIGFAFISVLCSVCAIRLVRYICKTWNGFGLALLSGGIVTLFLGIFDVFPIFPSSIGWGAWYMGVLFSLCAKDSSKKELMR